MIVNNTKLIINKAYEYENLYEYEYENENLYEKLIKNTKYMINLL